MAQEALAIVAEITRQREAATNYNRKLSPDQVVGT